jgi:hypothetical protein
MFTNIWMDKQNVAHTHTQEYRSALKGNSDIHNVNEPRIHCDKWNKPVTKTQTLCDSTYLNDTVFKIIEMESRMVVAKGWDGGEGEVII